MFINHDNDIFMTGHYKGNGTNAYMEEVALKNQLAKNNNRLQESIEYENSFVSYDKVGPMLRKRRDAFVNEVGIRGAERAFAFSLTEAYFNALVLDDDFKEKNENSIKSFFLTSLKEDCNNDIFGFMNKVKGKSPLLNELVEACKTKGRKLAAKASDKFSEDYDEVDKFFDDEDQDEIDLDYDNTTVEELSNHVKDKVVKVIKDEEEQSEKNKQMAQDIQMARESGYDAKIITKGPERHTLFKSLMVHHYKDTMFNLKESGVSSDYGTIDGDEIKVNMDYVMCDAILEYTKLELYNTIRLFDYNYDTVKELSESYLLEI